MVDDNIRENTGYILQRGSAHLLVPSHVSLMSGLSPTQLTAQSLYSLPYFIPYALSLGVRSGRK